MPGTGDAFDHDSPSGREEENVNIAISEFFSKPRPAKDDTGKLVEQPPNGNEQWEINRQRAHKRIKEQAKLERKQKVTRKRSKAQLDAEEAKLEVEEALAKVDAK